MRELTVRKIKVMCFFMNPKFSCDLNIVNEKEENIEVNKNYLFLKEK